MSSGVVKMFFVIFGYLWPSVLSLLLAVIFDINPA